MLRRSFLALFGSLLVVLSLTAGIAVASSQVEQASETSEATPSTPSTPPTYGDAELLRALEASSLVEEWIAVSPVSPEASLIEVTGSAAYAEARAEFLTALEGLGAGQALVDSRIERLESVTDDVAVLEALIRQVRRSLATSDRSSALSERKVMQARVTLAQIAARPHWLGFSRSPVSLAEHSVSEARAKIAHEVEELTRGNGTKAKTHGAAIARLSAVHDSLVDIAELVELGEEQGSKAQLDLAAEREAVIATLPAIHGLRTLAATSVSGLPLVTVDAYIQGAATLDDSCPVDWTLLAGIGRIESRHGTLDDATVQSSGRITKAIYGPLLDGGATVREAQAAVRAAEEAALLAEEEALEEERIAAEEAFQSSVWGQLQRAEGAGETEAVGAAADPATEEQDGENEDGENVDEDDDPDAGREFKGNGFAVIRDSDNGRLDGNARWDRAVGPMQFIPETWSYWETDGNADGVLDPQNLYDAAASAGRFLCHLSRSRGSSPWTFVLGYNSSETYVRNVMSAAESLRVAELPVVP